MSHKVTKKIHRAPISPGLSWSRQGAILPLAMGLTALVALAVSILYQNLYSSSMTSKRMLERRRAFYAADGTGRAVVKLGQAYLDSEDSPTPIGLQNYICTQAGGCPAMPNIVPSAYGTEGFAINSISGSTVGPLPSGPFSGMSAKQNTVSFHLKLRENAGIAASLVDQSVTIGKVYMFQFFLLSDGYADWVPGPPQDVRGRSHANGDLCIASSAGGNHFRLQQVTASGRVMQGDDARCQVSRSGAEVYVSNKDSPNWGGMSDFSKLLSDGDSGCSGCGGGSDDWQGYAASRWDGNLQDQAHGVPVLRLPIIGSPSVQEGAKADGTHFDNTANSRFLVDPVLITDNSSIREQKFAQKADIRIIDGVWYLRDPGNPNNWPGVPIWSDHPGTFTYNPAAMAASMSGSSQAVGQLDLASASGLNWNGSCSGPDYAPKRFSYYRTLVGSHPEQMYRTSSDPIPVLSYGTLKRGSLGVHPYWAPGHYDNDGDNFLSNALDSSNCSPSDDYEDQSVSCLLNATRSGFFDGHVVKAGVLADDTHRGRVLPTNFDVAALIAALNDTGCGELGSYFGAGHFMGAPFNGVVYITSTWSGVLDGLGTGWPSPHPDQGSVSTTHPDTHSNNNRQSALPFPLCSSAGSNVGQVAGDVFEGNSSGLTPNFYVPNCANTLGRPNVVRIINARNIINTTVMPKGLTIASNLPAYVLGGFNLSSNTRDSTSSLAAGTWSPGLVAADQVMLLSDSWDDEDLRWGDTILTAPNADSTTYNMQILAGWAVSANGKYSGGVENFPRFLENWQGDRARIRGSFVIGFNSVYWHWFRAGPYRPPVRDWGFDEHLNNINHQPPGAPQYNVRAVRTWRRD